MQNLAIWHIRFVVTKATDMILLEALLEPFPKSTWPSYKIQSNKFSEITLKMECYIVLELTALVISLNSQAQIGENQWSCLSQKPYKINKKKNIRIINKCLILLGADHQDQLCEMQNSSLKNQVVWNAESIRIGVQLHLADY